VYKLGTVTYENLYGFRITSQASRHKTRKHKLRCCRFRAIISAMFNYRCRLRVEQEKTEKMSFWTGFTGFTQKKRYRQDNRINKKVPNKLSSASCYPVNKFLFFPFLKNIHSLYLCGRTKNAVSRRFIWN